RLARRLGVVPGDHPRWVSPFAIGVLVLIDTETTMLFGYEATLLLRVAVTNRDVVLRAVFLVNARSLDARTKLGVDEDHPRGTPPLRPPVVGLFAASSPDAAVLSRPRSSVGQPVRRRHDLSAVDARGKACFNWELRDRRNARSQLCLTTRGDGCAN